MNARRVLTALVFVALILLAVPATAQVTAGSISGVAADARGKAIAGAKVKATAADGGAVTETATASSGAFLLAPVAPGAYTVEITAPGVWKAVMENVGVTAGSDTRLGTVTLSAASATLATLAAPPARKPAAATPATPEPEVGPFSGVELKQFPGLPENRGLDLLALQVPGVTQSRDGSFATGNPVPFSTNGLRSRNNDQQIDGQTNNENTLGGPATRIGSPEFVQQYSIITNQQGSQYGRNSGAVVNIPTQSGTAAWHGSIFGADSNSVFNAMTNVQRFAGLNEPSRSNDEFAGFTIGGPFIRDKVYLFGSFDQEILSQNTTYHTDFLTPTPAGIATLNGCFPVSQSLQAFNRFGPYGISGGSPTPAGTPVTGIVAGCPMASFAGLNRTLPAPVRTFDWLARADIHLGSDTITARYLFQRQTSGDTDFGGGAVLGFPVDLAVLSQGIQLGWTHSFSSKMLNQARASFGRFNLELGGNSLGTMPRAAQLNQAITNVDFMAPGFLGFGGPPNMPQSRVENVWQAQDNWSYLWGKHQLKAGGSFVYQRSPNQYLANVNGTYGPGAWDQFVPFLYPVLIANGSPAYDFREHDLFLYVQDDWKLRSDLTLTLGLTWSYFSQPSNLLHDLTTQREQSGTPLWNPALPLAVRTVPGLDTPVTNFGPNLGFAYSPQWGGFLTGHGKTIIRGGYRLLYDPAFYSMYRDMAGSAPTAFLAIGIGGTPAVPSGPNVRASQAFVLTPGVLDPRNQLQYTLAPDFTPDRVHTWNFGIERELVKNTAVEVRYVGNHALNLFQSVNANPLAFLLAAVYPSLVPAGVTPCPLPSAVVPSAVGRVDCNLGVVNERRNSGYSDYNALQIEFRANNLFRQLTLRTGYTWSKTTDNVSEIYGTQAAGNTSAFLQDPLASTGSEHTLSGLDFPHRWTLSFVEQLPFFKEQHGVIGHSLGGWGFAGNYTLASGQPYTPSQQFVSTPDYFDSTFLRGFNNILDIAHPFQGNANAPANAVGIFAKDACLSSPLIPAFASACGAPPNQLVSVNALNQSGVVVPVTAQDVRYIANGSTAQLIFGTPFGNVSRNAARDAITDIGNFSVFKDTKLSERVSLQLRATFLNVFNQSNFTSIDPFLEDAGLHSYQRGFADPSVTPASARSILFGGKITF